MVEKKRKNKAVIHHYLCRGRLGRGSNELGRGSNDLGRGMLKYKISYPYNDQKCQKSKV